MSASVKSVYLSDFQSHAETKIDLAPPGGLTVIVGPTDSGKTAIVRGLRLLYYNVPSGTEFIRVGRTTATVAIELSDGTKVARERGKSVNRYRIVKPGHQPQVFEGFGVSVPLDVQEVTGVRIVSIGETLDLALNLSEQLDGPFLGKAVSGPAKAKILGALAGTEEVDEAQRAVGLDLHRASQDESRLANEIKALDARIAEYDYLPRLAEQIEALTKILATVKDLQARLTSLESCAGQLIHIGGERGRLFDVLARWRGLRDAVSHVEYAAGALSRMQALSGHKASLASIATQRTEWGGRLARWTELDDAATLHATAEQAWHRVMRLSELKDDLAVTLTGVAKAQAVVQRWAGLREATVAEARATDALNWLKDLVPLRDRLAGLKDQAASARSAKARWAGLTEAQSVVSDIDGLKGRLLGLCALSQTITNIRQSRVVTEGELSRQSKALADAQALYTDTLVALGTCPLCGSKVSPESISLHIKEVA